MYKISIPYFLILSLLSVLLCGACKKEKLDNNSGQEPYAPEQAAVAGTGATIKIRVVNRMEVLPSLVDDTRYADTLQHLYGPVTLAYADGTPVSPLTTRIAVGSASPHVEIPYGTYQFKLLTADGRQIPADEGGTSYNMFDPASSQMYSNQETDPLSPLTYAPVNTYQPGGSYTITLRPNTFHLYVSGYPPTAEARQNQFMVTADEPVPANLRYGKVQGINAFKEGSVSFRFAGDSDPLTSTYGKASSERIFESGSLSVEAIDADGKTLATSQVALRAGQNLSLWLWPTADGRAQILPVFNDLSNTYFYYTNGEYGPDNLRTNDLLPTAIRFVNLCPDEPYISFTVNNGEDARKHSMFKDPTNAYEAPVDQVLYNLTPGSLTTQFPYTRWISEYNRAFSFTVFRSAPGRIPGAWAMDIARLPSTQFVAHAALYTDAARNIPNMEPGYYTVALIGRRTDSVSPKMIIVKHNK